MTFEEKLTWVNAVVTLAVAAAYFGKVGAQLGDAPVSAIAYQVPMLVAMGTVIVLTIVGAIVTSVGTAVGVAVGAAVTKEMTGEGSPEQAVADLDIDRTDERDVHIGRYGDRVGYNVMSALMVGVLALAMLRYDQFWIANAMFAALFASGLAASLAKIMAYRRGF